MLLLFHGARFSLRLSLSPNLLSLHLSLSLLLSFSLSTPPLCFSKAIFVVLFSSDASIRSYRVPKWCRHMNMLSRQIGSKQTHSTERFTCPILYTGLVSGILNYIPRCNHRCLFCPYCLEPFVLTIMLKWRHTSVLHIQISRRRRLLIFPTNIFFILECINIFKFMTYINTVMMKLIHV